MRSFIEILLLVFSLWESNCGQKKEEKKKTEYNRNTLTQVDTL